jgi:N-acetylglucosaminyldiphosphoundecaprenol N-acetyl-beta-D-mannosaminyltransferase
MTETPRMSQSPHRSTSTKRIPFLGVVYDPLEADEVLERLIARDPQAVFAQVVTPNSDHLVRIDQSGDTVRQAYLDAWLCLNDSRIVGMVAKARGIPFTTVPGADLVRDLFNSKHFEPSWPLLLVGGTPGMFATLVDRFGLQNAVHYDAPMGLLKDRVKFDATLAAIEDRPARFTLLAVGSPQQELLAHALVQRGKAKGIGLCIGAAVDFLVNPERRAPQWMSQAGLEWLFRLSREPRRLWRRYLIDSPKVFGLAFREWRAGRQGGK